MKARRPGELIQIDHMTVTKHNVCKKEFRAWDPVTKVIVADVSSNATSAAAKFLKKVVREMPFGHIQLKNMLALSEAGAIVSCASPGFYHRPATVGDQIDFVVGRVLDQFDFDNKLFKRWKEDSRPIVQPTKSKAK